MGGVIGDSTAAAAGGMAPEEQIGKLGSVGREWAGSGAIKLLDPDGNEVPDGEVGELFSRTAYVFDGYWKSPNRHVSDRAGFGRRAA